MDVVGLLESKNRCLRRFLELSSEFLLATDQGNFSGLEAFHTKRDATLKTLELYDKKIALEIPRIPTQAERTAAANRVRQILEERDQIVAKILNTDERIICRIEQEKARIAAELASSRKNKTHLNKFRSQWVPESGEELDKKL